MNAPGALHAGPSCAQSPSATSLDQSISFRPIQAAYLLALMGSLLFFGFSGKGFSRGSESQLMEIPQTTLPCPAQPVCSGLRM